jgi:hypothetical protein
MRLPHPHTGQQPQPSALLSPAVCFPGHSYPITAEHFSQVDPTHWVLDVCSLVSQQYWQVQEVR